MATIINLNGKKPVFGENIFLAETCTVIGDVQTGDWCSIWYHAVLRGDVCPIRIGDKVNIQDGAVIHGTYKKSEVVIGDNVTVGHNAIVHGAIIGDDVLVGMGAIILDNAEIGEKAIVASGSVVLENSRIEAGTLWAGVPAKFIKKIDSETANELTDIAYHYVKYAEWYRNNLK